MDQQPLEQPQQNLEQSLQFLLQLWESVATIAEFTAQPGASLVRTCAADLRETMAEHGLRVGA